MVTVVVVTIMGSPSGSKSLTNTLPFTGVFISVIAVSGFAIGASFLGSPIGSTSMYTVAVSQAIGVPLSQIVYSKESSPVNPVGGV